MGRKRTGCAQWDADAGVWIAWLTIGEVGHTHREPVAMRDKETGELLVPSHDASCSCTNKAPCAIREQAQAFAAVLAQRAIDRGAVTTATSETCEEYFTRWVAAREERGLVVVTNDRARYRKWISPVLGTRPIVEIASRDLEAFVHRLDTDVRAGKLAWKTAVHVWGLLTKLFDDAHRSKDLALRVRKDNPAREVRGPDRGDDRAGTFLTPAELLTLVSCEKISANRRGLWALAVYTGLRAGELRALAWADVHEDEGYIHVHRAVNRETGELKSTKTGLARKVPIEPTLLPLLEIMREQATGPMVLATKTIASRGLPIFLRSDLEAAGVKRRELFDDTATTRKLDFHDLRHTYGTWRAIRGDDVIKIRFAMGHTDLATTQRYINEAQVFDVARFGVPFGPLPIESLGKRFPKRISPQKALKNEWVDGDSNPGPTD